MVSKHKNKAGDSCCSWDDPPTTTLLQKWQFVQMQRVFFAIRIPYAKLLNRSISYNLFTMFENISKMSNCSIHSKWDFFKKQVLSQEGKLCTQLVNEKKWFSGINRFSIQVWSKLSHEKSWKERERKVASLKASRWWNLGQSCARVVSSSSLLLGDFPSPIYQICQVLFSKG